MLTLQLTAQVSTCPCFEFERVCIVLGDLQRFPLGLEQFHAALNRSAPTQMINGVIWLHFSLFTVNSAVQIHPNDYWFPDQFGLIFLMFLCCYFLCGFSAVEFYVIIWAVVELQILFRSSFSCWQRSSSLLSLYLPLLHTAHTLSHGSVVTIRKVFVRFTHTELHSLCTYCPSE